MFADILVTTNFSTQIQVDSGGFAVDLPSASTILP